jgi:hypothetical protein
VGRDDGSTSYGLAVAALVLLWRADYPVKTALAPLSRSSAGSNMPITDWLHWGDHGQRRAQPAVLNCPWLPSCQTLAF